MKVIKSPPWMDLKSIINHSVCNYQSETYNEILVKSMVKLTNDLKILKSIHKI